MLKQRLEQLRRLNGEKHLNFISAMNYFMDNIANNIEWLRHEKIFSAFPQCDRLLLPVAAHYGESVKITSRLLFWVKSQQFICGAMEFSNHLFVVLYFFEDMSRGLAAASSFSTPMKFFRLLEINSEECREYNGRLLRR
jgi:hypothetical protein